MAIKRHALILVVLMLTAVLVAGCSDGSSPINVKYEVTGTATQVAVTYLNGSGGISQEADVAPPWTYSFDATEPNTIVSLAASNLTDSGDVTVTIYKNGAVFRTATSTGGYVVATASGTL